jgi:hypothetical protein
MADSPKIPLLDKPGTTNWVEKYGALKPKGTNWIRRTAEHLQGKGMAEGRAIAVAVNAARRMCASGDTNLPGLQQVNPKSRAEACAAWLKWKAAAARAKASHDMAAVTGFRAVELAGPRLVRGLDLTVEQERALDLATAAFDPAKHARLPAGKTGGGRFMRMIAAVRALQQGESKTLHSATATKVKKLTATRYRVESGSKSVNVEGAGAAVLHAARMMAEGKPRKRVGRRGVTNLARRIDLARKRDPLLDLKATVERLKRHPKTKNLPEQELRRIAVARSLRREIRRRLGITDLEKLPVAQQQALKKAGLVGSAKPTLGQVVSYTIQRGKRKGQTIMVRRTASGWHEIKPHQTTTSVKAA